MQIKRWGNRIIITEDYYTQYDVKMNHIPPIPIARDQTGAPIILNTEFGSLSVTGIPVTAFKPDFIINAIRKYSEWLGEVIERRMNIVGYDGVLSNVYMMSVPLADNNFRFVDFDANAWSFDDVKDLVFSLKSIEFWLNEHKEYLLYTDTEAGFMFHTILPATTYSPYESDHTLLPVSDNTLVFVSKRINNERLIFLNPFFSLVDDFYDYVINNKYLYNLLDRIKIESVMADIDQFFEKYNTLVDEGLVYHTRKMYIKNKIVATTAGVGMLTREPYRGEKNAFEDYKTITYSLLKEAFEGYERLLYWREFCNARAMMSKTEHDFRKKLGMINVFL